MHVTLRYVALLSAEPKGNSEAHVSCPICNKKCRVSLIEAHVDIRLRREKILNLG